MSKNFRLLSLAIVGAVLLAATVFWNPDGNPPVTAGTNAEVSHGQPTNDRDAFSPPAVRREVADNLSKALLDGGLTEPPPDFQAVRPEPPRSWVAAAKQGLVTTQETVTEQELATRQRLAAKTVLPPADKLAAEYAIEPPRQGNRRAYNDAVSVHDESLFSLREPLEDSFSKTDVANPQEPASRLDTGHQVENFDPDEKARNVPTTSKEPILEAGDRDIGEVRAQGNIGKASTAGESKSEDVQAPSRSTVDNAETLGPGNPLTDVVESVDDAGHNQIASKPAEFNADTIPTEKPYASEAQERRQGPDMSVLQPVSDNMAVYIERLLDLLGFEPGPIDGVVGTMTIDAIVAFQKQTGRQTTGEVNDQLVAALEHELFTSFHQYLKATRADRLEPPRASQTVRSTKEAVRTPSGSLQTSKTVVIKADRRPAKEIQAQTSIPETSGVRARTKNPVVRNEARKATIPNQQVQQVRLEPQYESVVQKSKGNVPNAFEVCAQSGHQREYVKTESGFVRCEEFSFDGGIRR